MNSRPILTLQDRADLEEKRTERVFETYRGWSHEYALREIEARLTTGTEEGRAEIGVDGAPDLPQFSRGVWVVWLLASIFSAAIWGLIFLLGRWIVRVVYG